MNAKSKAAEQHDPWESGELGRSMDHAEVISDDLCRAIDSSLNLHPVSIRLERSLIQNLKFIAECRGVAYQPLIRDMLNRFAVSEIKQIMSEKLEEAERRAKAAGSDQGPVAEYLERERKTA
ncbi:hypothetical protein [Dyella jiangningensis]|uniref:Uncharacterized protein n=1 Tax=Dyella jiangningensis TaxID=1379159 RepID=A0A328P3E6_9GAMM|nr:hypothetical protein [Dyella jiangningensis]RAO75801.1 hypothetical protein CA260_17340 [Dyella jiangningensis]